MKKADQRPPRWMERIVEFYCRKELIEDLLGDLNEYYNKNITKGRRWANLIFLLDTIKFCRPYTIRKLKILGQMTFFNLMSNYFKTGVRSIARNKLFSAINITGLAISMSVGLLMISYIGELMTFDDFHEKRDRVYRVISNYTSNNNPDPVEVATTSVFIGDKLRTEYTGMEKVLSMRKNLNLDISKGENIINVRGHYASSEFFDVFSFELVSGDPGTALKEPNTIILTEKAAEKLFKTENPIGQIVTSDDDSYTVTGVIKAAPKNSHMQFEALVSFATLEKRYAGVENTSFFTWRSIWINYAYILLEEDTSPDEIQAYLDEIAKAENARTDRFTITHELQNLSDISPGKDLSNQIGRNISWSRIYELLGLTFIIIISACFNYTNLSIARALRRAKEVGIRKVVGASRAHILTQFVFEAIVISIFSLVIAGVLYLLLKPEFLHSIVDNDLIALEFRWLNMIYFLVFAIAIGFVSGIVPSLVLSKLKAISILMDVTKLRLFKGLNLRRVLIVIQFAMSMVLIIGATITYKQYNFSINYDLGFTADNILNLDLAGNDASIFMNELEKFPEISGISRAGLIPSTYEIWGDQIKSRDPIDSVDIFVNYVDKNYTDIHQMTFLAGETFPYDLKEDEEVKFVIIDRNLSERLRFKKPEDAVGVTLYLDNGEDDIPVQVSGVIENYRYVTIVDDPEPTALLQGKDRNFGYINMEVATTDIIGLMERMEDVWKSIEKAHPFSAEFMDQQIQASYTEYKTMYRVFTFLAILAIFISTMGLLGMAVFTAETRIKEVSIRKVLGATEQNLIYILSKGFMWMLLVSALIAIPFTYYFFNTVILVEFAEQIEIGVLELLPGVILIFAIGFLTIGWQTIKAAKTNPADMLRDE